MGSLLLTALCSVCVSLCVCKLVAFHWWLALAALGQAAAAERARVMQSFIYSLPPRPALLPCYHHAFLTLSLPSSPSPPLALPHDPVPAIIHRLHAGLWPHIHIQRYTHAGLCLFCILDCEYTELSGALSLWGQD